MSYNPYTTLYYTVQPVSTDTSTPYSLPVYPNIPTLATSSSLSHPSPDVPANTQPSPATVEPPRRRIHSVLNDGSREAWLKHVAKLSDAEAFEIPNQDILGFASIFVILCRQCIDSLSDRCLVSRSEVSSVVSL